MVDEQQNSKTIRRVLLSREDVTWCRLDDIVHGETYGVGNMMWLDLTYLSAEIMLSYIGISFRLHTIYMVDVYGI